MYVITGATGNTGKVIAETLLAKGKKVKVVGRTMERLKPLVIQGAEPFLGSLDDVSLMTDAFTGAKTVYTMIPPNYMAENLRAYQNKVGETLVEAVARAGVQYVVNLSSVGAHLSDGIGPIKGLHDMEQRLNTLSGVHIVHLRPFFFMENMFFNISLIKTAGVNGSPLKPDIAIPMVATRDIASVASSLLLRLDFLGKSVKELLGERDISMGEATRILGQAIEKEELPYVQFSYEAAQKAMLEMGFSKSVAEAFIEMYHGMNEGVVKPTEKRSTENTTPTRFEEFSLQFKSVYKNQA